MQIILMTVFSFVFVFFTGLAEAQQVPTLETTCTKMAEPVEYEYCISKVPGSQNRDLIYYMHGAGENARSWSQKGNGQAAVEYWVRAGKQVPTIVSVSFGRIWLLASRNSSSASGLYEIFTENVMPYLEQQVLKGGFQRRMVLGASMGGFNTSVLLLKNPTLFSRVGLVCPALVKFSPYESLGVVDDYIRRTKARWGHTLFMIETASYFFPSEEEWQVDSPWLMANDRLSSGFPPLHISCGDQDEFGFQEGAQAFAELATSRGVPATWQLLKGGHCVFDIESLTAFFSQQ